MKFKDNLRKIRNKSNFSQEKLAEEMSVSRQTISKWENGDSYPSTAHLFKLSNILNCSFGELVNGQATDSQQKFKKYLFPILGLAVATVLLLAFGLFRLSSPQPSPLDNAKLATFSTLAEDYLANTELLPKDTTKQIVGYGITDEDNTFYIKCNVHSSNGDCSAIIYFCEDNGNYSYKCQILDDPNYHPSGEYYQVI